MPDRKPVIGIPADRRLLGPHWFHCVGEKYVAAIAEAAGAVPVLLPAIGADLALDALLSCCDGLFLTGSPSNVEPHHYGGAASEPGTWHDAHRDATTLPLIRQVVEAGMPLLAVCRGFQEMNVAYGGTLHQRVHELAGHLNHRENGDDPLDVQYAPSHEVAFAAAGTFVRLVPGRTAMMVNSLHSQGVDRLAEGLAVEATAPDGLVEAFRVKNAPGFAIGVQWHPEWKAMDNDFSRALFGAFGEACRRWAVARSR